MPSTKVIIERTLTETTLANWFDHYVVNDATTITSFYCTNFLNNHQMNDNEQQQQQQQEQKQCNPSTNLISQRQQQQDRQSCQTRLNVYNLNYNNYAAMGEQMQCINLELSDDENDGGVENVKGILENDESDSTMTDNDMEKIMESNFKYNKLKMRKNLLDTNDNDNDDDIESIETIIKKNFNNEDIINLRRNHLLVRQRGDENDIQDVNDINQQIYADHRSSRPITLGSSMLNDSMTEIAFGDLQNENEPTSALLDYCKRKFLTPYVCILSIIGLNPITSDTSTCYTCFSYMQAFFILILLIFGYFVQYFCAYRGDRGFTNFHSTITNNTDTRTSHESVHTIGELLFGYIMPSILHVTAFISAIIVCKLMDYEQLQNLIERVFLMCFKPRQLCRNLWIYIMCGFLMLIVLLAYVVPSVLMQTQIVQVKWCPNMLKAWQWEIKATLLFTIFIRNLVEIIILNSYCVECYLLSVYLSTLSHKLLMHSIESLDWMREVLEFRKLLDHLNQRVAIPVCFLIVMNLSYAFAGIVYLFNDFDFHFSAFIVVVLNIINVLLWLLLGLLPFFMAASVNGVCANAQANGHHIRVRPFVYHNSSLDELNSTLLFASSLDMSAKLFRMPIQPNYLCFAILVISVVVLTLGMCLNFTALGYFNM